MQQSLSKSCPAALRLCLFRGRATLLVVAILVATFCASCAVTPHVPIAGEKQPCPAKTIDLFQRKMLEIRSLKATLDLDVSSDSEEYSFSKHLQVGLVAERPDKMRVNLYAGFVSLASVAVDADSLRAYLPSSSEILVGSLDDPGRILLPGPADFIIPTLKMVFFPTLLSATECTSEKIEEGKCRFEDKCKLEDYGGTVKMIRIVDSRTGNILRLELDELNGSEIMRTDYRDYRTTRGTSFPYEITLFFPLTRTSLRLAFKRVVLNGDIDEGVFKLKDIPSTRTRGFETLLK